jgi:hypothetical protein
MPQPCDREVFEKGQPLLAAYTGPVGGAEIFEFWIRNLAKLSGQRIDWHYSGGIAQVLFIGDRSAIVSAIEQLEIPSGCGIMRWFDDNSHGLYRDGVTEAPTNAIAGFMDPISGEQVFIGE